jgi:hypothetical protein
VMSCCCCCCCCCIWFRFIKKRISAESVMQRILSNNFLNQQNVPVFSANKANDCISQVCFFFLFKSKKA